MAFVDTFTLPELRKVIRCNIRVGSIVNTPKRRLARIFFRRTPYFSELGFLDPVCSKVRNAAGSVHEEATVHIQHVPGDITGLRGGEKSHCMGYFLITARASQRDMA